MHTTAYSQPMLNKRFAGPGAFASLRLMKPLQREPLETLQALTDEYGSMFRLQFGPSQAWVITDPVFVKRVLYENPGNYARTGLFSSMKPALGNGLMVSTDNDAGGLHELLASAFQPNRINSLSAMVKNCLAEKASEWQQTGESLDLLTEMDSLALDIICRLVFGHKGSYIAYELKPLLTVAHQWMNRRSNQMLSPPNWLPNQKNRRLQHAMQQLDDKILTLLKTAAPQGNEADNLLELLAGLESHSGEKLAQEVLVAELRGLLLLAQRNLGTALFWNQWLLARHTKPRQLVTEEALNLAKHNEDNALTTQATYSRAVVQESLRLYPPTWAFARYAQEDDVIGNCDVAAGSLILIPNYLVHRNRKGWNQPEKFMPERFSAAARAKRQRGGWLPFGAGPMQCVGAQISLSILQLTTLHTAQLGHWKVAADCEHPGVDPKLVLGPKKQVLATFVPTYKAAD